jgi:hypothetical protein
MDAEADARSHPALDARRDDESPAPAPGGRVSDDYARELNELRRVLDEASVVGHPRREAELTELRRLIGRYTDEARAILGEIEGHR